MVTLVFNTSKSIVLAGLPPEAEPYAKLREISREGAFAVVRLTLSKPRLARLTPQGQDWVLTLGDGQSVPLQPLPVNRSTDADGRNVVTVPLTDSSGVYWIDDAHAGERVGGERLAVVTAYGPPRGTPKLHRFVEFSLLPTVQELAISAVADDVIVRSGLEGVTISRQSGSIDPDPVDEGVRTVAKVEPVFKREPWLQARWVRSWTAGAICCAKPRTRPRGSAVRSASTSPVSFSPTAFIPRRRPFLPTRSRKIGHSRSSGLSC